MLCQETSNNLNQAHAKIAVCASCCERLLSADGQQEIVEMIIFELPSEFLLTESQIVRLTTLPGYIVQNHIQMVNYNVTFHHLNPDLVFDVNQKEYARVEGVSAGFGVDSESASDLSRGIGVSETVECWEKVQCTSARPHIDLVPGRIGTGTRLACADT